MDQEPDLTTVVEYSAWRGVVPMVQHSVVSKSPLQISSSPGIDVEVLVGVGVFVGVYVEVAVGVAVDVGVDV